MFRLINQGLNHLEEWLISFLIAAATLVVFVAVVHRFASGVPSLQPYMAQINMSWAQEMCIILCIWMAKFGAAYGVRAGVHVGVDVLVNRLGPKNRKALVLLGLFGGMLFTATIGTLGAHFVWGIRETGQVTDEMEMPQWIVYLCLPLGSFLMCFRFLQVIWAFWQTGELPHRDHAHVEGIDEDSPVDLDVVARQASVIPMDAKT